MSRVASINDWVQLPISIPCSKEPALDPIMRKFCLVYKFRVCFFKIYFNIVFQSTHKCLKLSFLLGFLTKRSMYFPSELTFYIPSPRHRPLCLSPYSCFMKNANRGFPHYGVLFAVILPSISYFRTRLVSMYVIGYDPFFVIYFVRFRILTEVSNVVVVSKLVTASIMVKEVSSVSKKKVCIQ